MVYPELSKQQIRDLAKLKMKKNRSSENLVVVEGRRTLEQLGQWGIFAQELYVVHPERPIKAATVFSTSAEGMWRICDSEHPPALAGLFALPEAREISFHTAFYLDGISDPGNMGTIFRIAAAFGIETILLSPLCCEVSSPKVIRASLGAVYHVPFRICAHEEMKNIDAGVIVLDMKGKIALSDFIPMVKPVIVALGSEAHGLSPELKEMAVNSVRISMPGKMESLNAAVCAGIVAYRISQW